MEMLQHCFIILIMILIKYCTNGFEPANYCSLCECEGYASFGCPSDNSSGIDFTCKKQQHVLCRFPVSRQVFPCEVFEFDHDIRRNLLDLLNGWRNRTAAGEWAVRGGGHLPPATNMMRLEWDQELAFIATRTLQQCQDYDQAQFVDYCHDSERFPTAAYKSSGSELTAESLVRDTMHWEANAISPSLLTITCDHIGKFFPGMFFQKVIWAPSRYVGCAYADRGDQHEKRYMLVCYLGPTGSGSWLYQLYKGQTAYKVGRPQSRCPRDAYRDHIYTALCRSRVFRGSLSGNSTLINDDYLNKGQLLLLILILPVLIYFIELARSTTT